MNQNKMFNEDNHLKGIGSPLISLIYLSLFIDDKTLNRLNKFGRGIGSESSVKPVDTVQRTMPQLKNPK